MTEFTDKEKKEFHIFSTNLTNGVNYYSNLIKNILPGTFETSYTERMKLDLNSLSKKLEEMILKYNLNTI